MSKQLRFFGRIAVEQCTFAIPLIFGALLADYLFGNGKPVSELAKFTIMAIIAGALLGAVFRFAYYRDTLSE